MKKKKKQNKLLLYIIIALVCVPFVYNFFSSFVKIQKLQKTKSQLEQKIEQQKALELQYQEELDRIGTPKYYEYLARKYFGYIYPDEKLMIEENEPTDQQPETE